MRIAASQAGQPRGGDPGETPGGGVRGGRTNHPFAPGGEIGMSAFRRTRLRVLGAGWLALTLIMAGCGSGGGSGGSSSSSGGPIVIGADLPMTGSLARFGTLMKLAYQTEINTATPAAGET